VSSPNKNMPELGFDTKIYLREQIKKIKSMIQKNHTKLYIEFGGKIIQDKHSARVLPGYEEDVKLEILKKICRDGEAIFVVSSRDILRNRVRGDFKTDYFQETIRNIQQFKNRGLNIKYVVISLLDKNKPVPVKIKLLEKKLKPLGITTYYFFSINNYTKCAIKIDELTINPFININKKIIAIISPGGGSGKFGVCLNQLYHEMRNEVSPHYLKFETFPIHNLPLEHPLNLAYMAASADFHDIVMRDKRHGKATSYNRDIENYELLNILAKKFPTQGKNLKNISSATNMGANMITKGIINDEIVQKEAAAEIARRLIRYKFEVAAGKENKKVLNRVRTILKML
jgi:uncharacterized protein (UPF0371 family)